jgi:hypothetical protein
MARRLLLPPNRVDEVARAAHVSVETVRRYRQRNGDGSPRHGLHDASLYLIEKAIRELPESPQLELQGSHRYPREPLVSGPSATSSDHSPVPKVSVVTNGDAPLSLAGESAAVETNMARLVARETETARTSSPLCKDPVSAPARAAAGGAFLKIIKRAPRSRLRIEMPDGCDVPATDGHWWEERTADA